MAWFPATLQGWYHLAQVWLGRILLTVLIVAAWEYGVERPQRERVRRQRQQQMDQQQERQRQLEIQRQQKEDEWACPFPATALVEDSSRSNVDPPGATMKTPSPEVCRPSSPHASTPDNDQETTDEGDTQEETPPDVIGRKEDPSEDATKKATKEETTATMSAVSNSPDPPRSGTSSSTLQSVYVRTEQNRRLRNLNVSRAPPTSTTTRPEAPPMTATSGHHPGLQAFYEWYEIETSLYRMYTLTRRDGQEVVPPYAPHSARGKVPIFLHVVNETAFDITVYWVGYKGQYVNKGTIRPNHQWTQTTWIDHPWVFEGPALDDADPDRQVPYFHYVPYRVIPTLPNIPTVSPDDPSVGRHQFKIQRPPSGSPHYVAIQDKVMPTPPANHFVIPDDAMEWTSAHMDRIQSVTGLILPLMDDLIKYLMNMQEHPDVVKYRQIRLRSKRFQPLWDSPIRGILLALGFVPVGAYAELGTSRPLLPSRIEALTVQTVLMATWKDKHEKGSSLPTQPDGADGYGRAGFSQIGRPEP